MWFGTEEDSPTNKAKSLRRSLPPPFYKGAIAPSTSCTRVRGKSRACVYARARVRTRARVHTRASLLDINAQGDTLGKRRRFFFEKVLTEPFFCAILVTKK
jgi:hypothetical protein